MLGYELSRQSYWRGIYLISLFFFLSETVERALSFLIMLVRLGGCVTGMVMFRGPE